MIDQNSVCDVEYLCIQGLGGLGGIGCLLGKYDDFQISSANILVWKAGLLEVMSKSITRPKAGKPTLQD
jgi:hypothetical protein